MSVRACVCACVSPDRKGVALRPRHLLQEAVDEGDGDAEQPVRRLGDVHAHVPVQLALRSTTPVRVCVCVCVCACVLARVCAHQGVGVIPSPGNKSGLVLNQKRTPADLFKLIGVGASNPLTSSDATERNTKVTMNPELKR